MSALRPVAKRSLSRVLRFRDLVRRERVALRTVPMPLRDRLGLWRHGFSTDSGLLFDLADGRGELYVNDLDYALRTPLINGVSNPTLDDKVIFFHTMRSVEAPTPAVHGVVTDDGIAWFGPARDGGRDEVLTLLEHDGELVLKPKRGGKGDRISFVAHGDGRIHINGQVSDEAHLHALLTPDVLICQRVHQGAWAATIFPGATNTMRLFTMWDLERGEPFVARGVHRFGTWKSAPVDNYSKGGLAATVDLETGELGAAITAPSLSGARHYTVHPDTGAPIAGVLVPGFTEICDAVLDVNRRLSHIPYIGWDVLVGDDRWWIIEGNHFPDTQMIQAFGPLLADPRVRRFYEHHNVVRS